VAWHPLIEFLSKRSRQARLDGLTMDERARRKRRGIDLAANPPELHAVCVAVLMDVLAQEQPKARAAKRDTGELVEFNLRGLLRGGVDWIGGKFGSLIEAIEVWEEDAVDAEPALKVLAQQWADLNPGKGQRALHRLWNAQRSPPAKIPVKLFPKMPGRGRKPNST
jgi:hypothetical protein